MTSPTPTFHEAPVAFASLPTMHSARGLTPAQRGGVTAVIVAAHLAGIYGLLQVREVRDTLHEAAPMFVDWIAPPKPEPKPPEPLKARPTPQVVPKRAPVAPIIAAAPSPSPAAFTTAAPELPVDIPSPVVTAAPAPPAPPAPAPAPKVIPASAVQYLEAPVLEYPRLSRRNGESGQVGVRVWIDAAGLPKRVQVNASSGFPRLDDAAVAAVQKARFRPYTENGQPVEGWALIPLKFELER